MHRVRLGRALYSILAALLAPQHLTAATPLYEVRLDDRFPGEVRFTRRIVETESFLLGTSAVAEQQLLRHPACGGRRLIRQASGQWVVPRGCREVEWSARLASFDPARFDSATPDSIWRKEGRFWLLTGSLPWLRRPGQAQAELLVTARLGADRLSKQSVLPPERGVPPAVVMGRSNRIFGAPGFRLQTYGSVPGGVTTEKAYRQLAEIHAQWRRDLLPRQSAAFAQLNHVWFTNSPTGQPGIFASSNSDAILMQYLPEAKESEAKLEAAILLTGGHEGFHSLLQAVPGSRPSWVNESLPTYFAYRSAKPHLSEAALALAAKLIEAPEPKSLLTIQRELDGGDSARYGALYSKGARFWAAIEPLLNVRPSACGRVAALFQQTGGMQGLDWSNSEAIAVYLDRWSDGRAGPVVRCYLEEDGCTS